MKKILIALLILILAGAGVFFYMSQERFEEGKYKVDMTDGLKYGSFVSFNLPDQFGNDVALDSSIQKLIIVFKKERGHEVNEFLASKPKDYLKSKNALLMADISKMPIAIRNMFALPSLKKNGYPTALMYNEALAKVFLTPGKVHKIHFITLMNNRIVSVEHVSDMAQLEKLLK